jgi:putative transcriptional regulator
VVTALLVLFLAGGVVLAASTAVGAVRGHHTITVDRVITPEHLTALPANVEPTNGYIPVTVTIHDARPAQLFLRLAIDLLPGLLILAALWQLWGLLRSARQGDPFTTANVRRLRKFGWLLLLGWPLVAYVTTDLKAALADTAPPVVTSGLGLSLFAPRSLWRSSSAWRSWCWPRCSPTACGCAKTSKAPSEMPPEPSDHHIAVHLDRLLEQRDMTLTELADKVGVTVVNLSVLKNGRARAIRFSTLAALCQALGCQPGDLLSHQQ